MGFLNNECFLVRFSIILRVKYKDSNIFINDFRRKGKL